jgi:hypothetical protein
MISLATRARAGRPRRCRRVGESGRCPSWRCPRTVQRERKRRRRYLPVARGDVEEAVSGGSQPHRMKARAHPRVRRGGTRSGPQASPAARALYFSLALQLSPPVSQTARRPTETAPAVSLRKSCRLIFPPSITLQFSSPLRCALKLPSSRKAVSSIRTPEVRIGRSDLSRPQHMLGLALKLPDPLLRHPQLLRELCEGRGLFLVEAVPLDQHAPMALR